MHFIKSFPREGVNKFYLHSLYVYGTFGIYPSLLGKFNYDVSFRAADRNLEAGWEAGPLFAGLLMALNKGIVLFII